MPLCAAHPGASCSCDGHPAAKESSLKEAAMPLLEGEDDLAAERGSFLIDAGFFGLGSASDITFNGLILCVAYLRGQLGSDVLSLVGRAQFLGSALVMLLTFGMALRNPGGLVHGLHSQCRWLFVGMLYLLGLNATLLVFVAKAWKLNSAVLQIAMFVCGLMTGLSQSLVSAIAGMMTKFGGHTSAASAQMSGVGFGIALPTAVQLCLMPLNMSDDRLAGLSDAVACVVMLGGVIALCRLRRTALFRKCEEGGADSLSGRSVSGVFAERFFEWALRRLKQVLVPSGGLFFNFAGMVYCQLMTPHVRPIGDVPRQDMLPTLLMGITNICDCVGRLAMLRVLQLQSSTRLVEWVQGKVRRARYLWLLLFLRLIIIAACISYTFLDIDELHLTSNAMIIALYAVGALIGGCVTVGLTNLAQATCMLTSGVNMDTYNPVPCPLAGQIMFLACILGSTTGTLLPYPS
eukprot:TRINITY_DN12461_c0_g1_i1.p1 TRINITY_DN12461_c0_g1~~TRINITY_DN12461_c0_g1_i1.p1  ORF type:complete len:481 (+),score=63.98 TRINITY_DN12461_c0_g1_i1:59-1444(+)